MDRAELSANVKTSRNINKQNRLLKLERDGENQRVMLGYGGHFDNGLTSFDAGGSHEMNPYGGIFQGIGANGKPNFVEEGETKWNDYIFSDRLKINNEGLRMKNEELRDKNEEFSRLVSLLPKKVKGKSFADASKIIGKESKERELDAISKRGKDSNLNRLAMLQEQVREREEMRGLRDTDLTDKTDLDGFYSGGGNMFYNGRSMNFRPVDPYGFSGGHSQVTNISDYGPGAINAPPVQYTDEDRLKNMSVRTTSSIPARLSPRSASLPVSGATSSGLPPPPERKIYSDGVDEESDGAP